ncbi:hypothetical protein ASH00_14240 [Arthrobacter sp. Soil782]|uniref:LysM peptidoglycan-binding domain-containing protein n=1 Tax=Arthrobacter sp. Soil782 TaxID=1736410 RepID=UPI0006F501AB|nr:LysM domain-containing protein [Arthrobacter sp. Soil782]KRF04266.1 hypothetical protein ASH00_14240 [Arthrobacter sp. Soil782]
MESTWTETGSALAILLLGGALAFGGKLLADGQELSATGSGLTTVVGTGVAILGALVLAWWTLSFCFAILAELLRRQGRPRVAHRIGFLAPTFMRRAACLALGVNLITVPCAHAGTAVPPLSSAAVQANAGQANGGEEISNLNPQWVPVEAPQVLKPSWQPSAQPTAGGLLVKDPRDSGSDPGTGPEEMVVQPGDSLWSLTARHLGPAASDAKVAEVWPQWYAANRDVIGDNPELLLPGQILHPPIGASPASK